MFNDDHNPVKKSMNLNNNNPVIIVSTLIIVILDACALQEHGLAAIAELDACLSEFNSILQADDKQAVPLKAQQALAIVGKIEADMVKGFPFKVPDKYANLPQLLVGGPGGTYLNYW